MIWTEESIAYLRDAERFSDYYSAIAERIARHLPPDAELCDAGCGSGGLSLALLGRCARITAVDRSEAAIDELKRRMPREGITALCADVETLRPRQPYDAMVFCLFGRVEESMRLAARMCRGTVFLVKRDYTHHRFSAGQVSLGDYTAERTAQVLEEHGIPYTVEHFSSEFGQPFRSLEAAERFFALYNRSEKETLSRGEIAARLVVGPTEEFPYYLPHRKKLCLFSFQAKNIPEEVGR